MTNIFSIDGDVFGVDVIAIKREAPFLDKFAGRTESGDLQRGLIGVYFNYTLSFPKLNVNMSEYKRLYDKLTEPVEYHVITIPDTVGTYTYTAYVTGVEDELLRLDNTTNFWGNMTARFIAKSPARG